jgi:hypothetical protein
VYTLATGTITVHALDLTVPFLLTGERMILGTCLDVADTEYGLAAAKIASLVHEQPGYEGVQYIEWQNIVGIRQCVRAGQQQHDVLSFVSLLDPRCPLFEGEDTVQ